jgi:hypothetical protein
MLFQKFHHLLPILNDKIRTIAESGLLTKWQKDSTKVARSTMTTEKDKGGHGGSVQMKLRVEHVEGAFLVVLVGLSVAFAVFLLELLTHRLIKKNETHRILKTMESFLCRA